MPTPPPTPTEATRRNNTPARVQFVVTPGQSFHAFFQTLTQTPLGTPPNPQHLADVLGRYGMQLVGPNQ